jgi:neutral ceramidase
MKAKLHFLLLLVVGLLASSGVAAEKAAAKAKAFRAGAATSNITPDLGGPVVGGFHPFPATHIHDELHARCLVLDNGETRLAFVVCDILGMDRGVFDEARRLVVAETGMPGAHMIMSATHTHSAVSALGKDRFTLNQPLDEYQKFVARRIADGVRRAINNLAPARIGWGSGSEPREVFNRRWYMKPGTVPKTPYGETNDLVKMNPPRGSANLDRPAGPTDPEICLIAVQSLDGKPMALLANYSLHYVGGVGNGHVSADYFALFCDRIQQLLGADRQDPPFVAMLSNGTSGNINNIDFANANPEKFPPYGKMTQVADRVAQAALKAYQGIQWHDTVPLGGQLRELTVGTRHPTPQQLARAKAIVAAPKPPERAATLEEIYAERALNLNEYPPTITIPIQVLRVGDVAVGGVPCEVFVEIGLEYKKRSPFKSSFIMEIANGYFGYLPTPEHHKLGGYETWLGTNRLEVDASTKILAALLEMAGKLR